MPTCGNGRGRAAAGRAMRTRSGTKRASDAEIRSREDTSNEERPTAGTEPPQRVTASEVVMAVPDPEAHRRAVKPAGAVAVSQFGCRLLVESRLSDFGLPQWDT